MFSLLPLCFILKGSAIQRDQRTAAHIRRAQSVKVWGCGWRYINNHTPKHKHAHTRLTESRVALRTVKLQKLNQRNIQELTAIQVSLTFPHHLYPSLMTVSRCKLTVRAAFQPNNPTMVMDYWTGWYDIWGELHHVLPPEGKEGSLCC